MVSNNLYDSLLENDSDFNKYSLLQEQTYLGKKLIVDELKRFLIPTPIQKKICLVPSDTGIIFDLLYKALPNNDFFLIDKSSKSLDSIKKSSHRTHATFIQELMENFDNVNINFDLILTIFGIHLLPSSKDFIRSISNHILPGGKICLVTMSPEQELEHPMTKYFPIKTPKTFLELESIISDFLLNGMFLFNSHEIVYNQSIHCNDVENIFSKLSNSFLFKYDASIIKLFHNNIKALSHNNIINLKYRWTLLIFNKG